MFTLLDRDDYECRNIHNQRDCIVKPSEVVPGYDKCNWYTNDQTCNFRQPQQTLQTVVGVTCIAAVLSVPVARFVEYLLIRVAVSSNSAAAADRTGITSETVSILKKPKPDLPDETEADLDGEGTPESEVEPRTVQEYLYKHLCVVKWSVRRAQMYSFCKRKVSELCGTQRRAKIYADMNAMAEAAVLEMAPAAMAQNKGHLVKVDEVMEMYKLIDSELYHRYPLTLRCRRLLHLPVPIGLQAVDFIDAVSVREEVAILLTRLKQYAADETKASNLVELERVLGKLNYSAFCIVCAASTVL
jgi:hypothetical protein